MDEKLIDYFFGFAQSKGFKRNREDFVKYLQSDDKLFDYLYGVAESKGYKRDKEHFAGLVGRTQKAAPVTTESVTTEPATESVKTEVVNAEPVKATESAKSEPVKAEPVAEETATDYSGVDTTPMERKGERSTPIKGIDQITVEKVDLSDKEKADRLKSVKEATKDVSEEDKKLALNDSAVNNSIESKLMPVTEKTQVKEVVPEEKKKEIPTDIKVKEVTKEEPMKVKFKDKSEYSNLNYIQGYDTELSKKFDNNHVERVNFKNKLPGLSLGTISKEDGDSSSKLSIAYDKKNEKWYSYDFNKYKGKEYDKWEEVKSDKLVSFLKDEFKDVVENKSLEAKNFRELKSDYTPETSIASIYLRNVPEKSIKPFGENGPTVYFDEKENEYFTKENGERNVIEKGSDRYNKIENKIIDLTLKQPSQNNLDCPPGETDCSNKDNFATSQIFLREKDRFNLFGKYTQKEGNLAKNLDEKIDKYNDQEHKNMDDARLFLINRDLNSDYKLDDPKIESYRNKVFYINQNPPTSKRFSTYYLDNSNKSYIYDNETNSILKQLDDEVDLPVGGKNKVWETLLFDTPEYKKTRDLIEIIKSKKGKSTKNTFVPLSPNFDPTGTPDWLKK